MPCSLLCCSLHGWRPFAGRCMGRPSRRRSRPTTAIPTAAAIFVVPGLTWEKARSLRSDRGFNAAVSGHVYAQPLYWRAPGSSSGMLLVATEQNKVHALDAGTGRELWQRAVGKPVARSALGCGKHRPRSESPARR